ncbi:hypothetical protein N7530_009460 [Penicillium desertorum]|uniref:Uncharacterized protein n=1 Tax=Penicillium desertorum TaxID=1303715 RepID=A0A9X0BI76_9EURO|nr:hypothetical protein N7530_009460 [Penicillium desertorum]
MSRPYVASLTISSSHTHGSLTLTRPTNIAALLTMEGHNIVDEKELRDISSAIEGVVQCAMMGDETRAINVAQIGGNIFFRCRA